MAMHWFRWMGLGGLSAAAGFTVVLQLATAQDSDLTIDIIRKPGVGFVFAMEDASIKTGQSIKWVSKDGTHQLKAIDPKDAFKETDEFEKDQSRTLKFEKSGVITYECVKHPTTMKGKITVSDAAKR